MESKYGEQAINSLLQKVRIFNKAIGAYEMFAITENFNYAVKLSNGKITIKIEDLQDDERDALTPERLTAIADSFKSNTATIQSPIVNKPEEPKGKKKSNSTMMVLGIVALVALIGGLAFFKGNASGDGSSSTSTYQEKVMSVEEMERAEPTKFLSASASYKENFWGNKLKVQGTITNSATAVTFKDAVIRITYYSKTNTALGSTENTIYEALPPTSNVNFEFKVDNYKDVASLGVEIISASAF